MEIRAPIIVVGIGRCGSTLVQEVLARHPGVAWISGLANRFPDRPALNGMLMRLVDWPGIGPSLRSRLRPSEHYHFWDHYCAAFSEPCRDLVAEDLSEQMRRHLPAALAHALTPQRSRLLLKVTGWPRVGFLHALFPDVRIVHIVRDGRAVANSFLNVRWWGGWRGPENWRWGPLTPDHALLWRRHSRSFVGLAAIQLLIYMEAFQQARRGVPDDSLLELRYEDICVDPIAACRRILAFGGLSSSDAFEAAVRRHPIRSANDKWQFELTPLQQRTLAEVLEPYQRHYGYI